MRRRHFGLALAYGACRWWLPSAAAQEMQSEQPLKRRLNAVLPTLGGRQFWADEQFFHGWHIQRNVLTGHYRLLDAMNLRHAWGTLPQCAVTLDEIKRARRLPPMRGAGIVILHGLFRSASSMSRMARYLEEQGGYSVFNVNYPTTRGSLAEHAADLANVVRSLEGISEINFVAHSLGNLVIRHYLGDQTRPAEGLMPDPRIRRIVMLGPPNQGAQVAEALNDYRLFHLVAGRSGTELGGGWAQLEPHLATPACQFGILAGGRGTDGGYNPLLGEDNDMVVSVDSTRLAGAADFAVLPVLHSLMMNDPRVEQYTLSFLKHGYFTSPADRHPIVPAAQTVDAGAATGGPAGA